MKMKKSIILLTMAAVLLCGCDSGKSHTSVTEDSQQSAIENYSVSEELTVETDPPTQTTEAAEEFPFYGMEIPTDSLTVGNLPANVKISGSNAFFCCDENGEIYYTNLKDNGFLYHLNGSKQEKLVDLKACNINSIGDEIFFISPNGSLWEYRTSGAIYRYSKTEKQCEIFLDENVSYFHVTVDGLYYMTDERVTEGDTTITSPTLYFRGFQSDVSVKQNMNYWLEVGGYHLEPSEERNAFFMTNGEISVDIAAGDTMIFVNGCICQNKIYAFFKKTFRILDLETGEMMVYTGVDFDPRLGSGNYEISGYTVIEGCVYLCFGGSIIAKIEENSDPSFYLCDNKPSILLKQMYTDGSNLYVISGNEIFKIVFSDNGSKYSVVEIGEIE